MQQRELEAAIQDELDRLGFDLVELRHGGTRSRPLVEVRIDRRDGEAVAVDDCARASRAIEARLEGAGLVAENYVLEVSSPGVERPLRTPADWRRFTGRKASVNSVALGGRFEVEIVGVEVPAGDESGAPAGERVVVRLPNGDERAIALTDVKDARLVFQWKP